MYFTQLFQKKQNVRGNVINLITTTINGQDNASLREPFTLEELKTTTFSMQADKCPGLDSFNSSFYQHFWDMCAQ
jgi:hypothetical protein